MLSLPAWSGSLLGSDLPVGGWVLLILALLVAGLLRPIEVEHSSRYLWVQRRGEHCLWCV